MKHKRRRSGRIGIKNLPGAALQKTVRALELTPDILSGMAHFELSGNREAVIDGCRGVIEYDENVIRLSAGKFMVRLTGRGLELRNFKKDSVIIEGYITSIEFSD
jgi:sporulation protein YqfC